MGHGPNSAEDYAAWMTNLRVIATGRAVIVVSILVSRGSVSPDKLPRDIGGSPSVYAGATLLPHPAMSRWIEARVRNATNASAVAEPREARSTFRA